MSLYFVKVRLGGLSIFVDCCPESIIEIVLKLINPVCLLHLKRLSISFNKLFQVSALLLPKLLLMPQIEHLLVQSIQNLRHFSYCVVHRQKLVTDSDQCWQTN